MGVEADEYAALFETSPRKRHAAVYDTPGAISETEADELLAKAREFCMKLEDWMDLQHPQFSAADPERQG
jgi:hypothetical protein